MSISIQRHDPNSLTSDFIDRWRAWAGSPMQQPEWMLPWWQAFRSANFTPMLMGVHDRGELIGITPFLICNCWSFGRVLRFFGSGAACSDFQKLLTAPGRELVVADAVAEWLTVGSARQCWDLLELDGVASQCPALEQLMKRLAQQRTTKQVSRHESTWRLDLSGGWEGFMKRLSKSQRAQTRNLINRFDKQESCRYLRVNDAQALAPALRSCIELHQRRWTSVGEPGCFSDSRFTHFLQDSLRALAKFDLSEIGILECDGKAVASQICLKDTEKNYYVYQSGRDPAFDSQRVGQTLTLAAIRHACEQGASFIDYLRGDEIYKQRLKATPSISQRIRIFAPGTLPSLRYGAWKVGRSIKTTATQIGDWLGNCAPSTTSVLETHGTPIEA